VHPEDKPPPPLQIDGDVEVCVPQVDGRCPVPSADGMADVLGHLHAEVRSVQVRRVEALEVDHGAHTSVLLPDKEDVADKTGGGGTKGTSSMAPFSSRAATSVSMKGLFAPCDGVEKAAPEQESGGGDVKGEW
jgi:hypothetical protein